MDGFIIRSLIKIAYISSITYRVNFFNLAVGANIILTALLLALSVALVTRDIFPILKLALESCLMPRFRYIKIGNKSDSVQLGKVGNNKAIVLPVLDSHSSGYASWQRPRVQMSSYGKTEAKDRTVPSAPFETSKSSGDLGSFEA